MKYYLAISNRLIVSYQEQQDVAQLIAKNGGRELGEVEVSTEEDIRMITECMQDAIDQSLQILDERREEIEIANQFSQKIKKDMN